MAPLLLLLLPSRTAASSAVISSRVSIAARGFPLLLPVLLLVPLSCWLLVLVRLLVLVLEVGSRLQPLGGVSKSSRVRINQGGSFEVSLFSLRHAVSFSSCTARLTSRGFRWGRLGGKFCTMLLRSAAAGAVSAPRLEDGPAAADCCEAAAWLLLVLLVVPVLPLLRCAHAALVLLSDPGLLPGAGVPASVDSTPFELFGAALHGRAAL